MPFYTRSWCRIHKKIHTTCNVHILQYYDPVFIICEHYQWKVYWRESKNQFLRGEKWEDGEVTRKGNVLRVLYIHKTCHENGNKSCFRKNLKVNFCQAFVDIVNTETSVDICSQLFAVHFYNISKSNYIRRDIILYILLG